MEIRDVIHGSIAVESAELPILDSRYFQRLRQIRQLGFAEYSYPSATHNRYIHSLGAMHTASLALQTLFEKDLDAPRLSAPAYARFRAVTRLAALLHDIGHGPLSHTTEFAMPDIRSLGLPGKNRQATHEDYTLKILLNSGLTPLLDRAGARHGFTAQHVAALIDPTAPVADDFFHEKIDGESVDFRPVLQQLVSSELDADRMDYLRRDSWQAGVSYGHFDFDWLVGNLTCNIRDGRCYLGLQHRALYSFEDFLISRFHMFMMVYFHYKSVVYDAMLGQYLSAPGCDYQLPSDIEAYMQCTDAQLYSHLAKSRDPWAIRISDKRPYRMLMELHSGIPATKTAAIEQSRLLARVQNELAEQKIHVLTQTSTGQLSKYFRKPADPIFVRYDNHYSAPSWIPLQKCTDLFSRYEEKRTIARLYVSPEDFPRCRYAGRNAPLRYEEEESSFTLRAHGE